MMAITNPAIVPHTHSNMLILLVKKYNPKPIRAGTRAIK
jgi:hypothetical protein